MNKGKAYGIPGIGLAGDWPGGWTQTYAQLDTEAGPHGFDKDYFVQQVAGLSQLTGELMLVKPVVIDLGWGNLKSALVKLPDSGFVAPHDAAMQFNLGYVRNELKQHAKAVEAFTEVVKLKPVFDTAWYGMGLAHAALGEHPAAVDAFEQAARRAPDTKGPQSRAGDLL